MSVSLQTSAVIALQPWDIAWTPRLFAWLHEHPESHFDDTMPRDSMEAFSDEIVSRQARGERLYAVLVDGQPAGAIGYVPMTDRLGMLHGVCISRRVSGRGVADAALAQVLAALQLDGVQKVSAAYFANNRHIRACLQRVGFVDEGFLQDHMVQGGIPVSMWLVAKLLKG